MKNRSGIINIILYLVIIALFVTSFWYSMNYRTVETSIVTADTDEISFSWWGNDERHNYTLEGVDLFERENPGISVDCKYSVWSGYENRNRIYMLSGDEPDVMQINYNWIRQYSPDGNGYYDLYQLSDYIDLSPSMHCRLPTMPLCSSIIRICLISTVYLFQRHGMISSEPVKY